MANRECVKIVIIHLFDPGGTLPSLLVSASRSQGYRALYVDGNFQKYKLVGTDNKNVPFEVSVCNGYPISVIHGDRLRVDSIGSGHLSSHFNAFEILTLNLQLTMRHLDAVFIESSKTEKYDADFLLLVVSEENLGDLTSFTGGFEAYPPDIPAGVLIVTGRKKREAGDRIVDPIMDIQLPGRPICFLGTVDEGGSVIDADLSVIWR